MTSKQWIEKFLANKNLLCDLMVIYHSDYDTCYLDNKHINKAIVSYDYNYLYQILSEVWLDMPELAKIDNLAFDILCSMLDNPVEEML